MAFSIGRNSVSFDEIKRQVTDAQLISFYLGITEIPCIIRSPLRKDNHPSFGLYSNDGKKVYWTDLATKERGGVYDLLSQMWHCDYREVLVRIQKDIRKLTGKSLVREYSPDTIQDINTHRSSSEIGCKVRNWRDYDLEYWASYGISLEWLKYAEVYPISHKIVKSGSSRYVFGADKYAYAYVEHKDGKVTLKIYQPFSKEHKWSNKHDRSVISLWTKIPESGERVVICSSLKDALCLWANTGIPAVAVQGEGYGMSETAISELKRRFTEVYILFDNDDAGLTDGERLAEQTGFINITLPPFKGGKDISDMYKSLGADKFHVILKSVLGIDRDNSPYDLPF